MKYIKLFEDFTKSIEESVVIESHFKVGDKVEMSHGGVGVVKSLDKEDGADDEKYYNIELPNGDIMKHAPHELKKINEAKIQKFIESLSASKEAKNILHNLDVFAQLNPDYAPVEAIAYIEEGLKTSGNAIKKAKKISDLLYTAGILASDIEVFGRDVLSIIIDGIAGKLA
jgi:RNA polymerase-interacting CarD/CdnL/TRCF family regulator